MSTEPLLEEGLIWRIGDRKTVKVWKDRWLPKPVTFRIQSPMCILHENAKVKELIDSDTKQWNTPFLRVVFLKEEVKEIGKIPISTCNNPEQLIWRCTTYEKF